MPLQEIVRTSLVRNSPSSPIIDMDDDEGGDSSLLECLLTEMIDENKRPGSEISYMVVKKKLEDELGRDMTREEKDSISSRLMQRAAAEGDFCTSRAFEPTAESLSAPQEPNLHKHSRSASTFFQPKKRDFNHGTTLSIIGERAVSAPAISACPEAELVEEELLNLPVLTFEVEKVHRFKFGKVEKRLLWITPSALQNAREGIKGEVRTITRAMEYRELMKCQLRSRELLEVQVKEENAPSKLTAKNVQEVAALLPGGESTFYRSYFYRSPMAQEITREVNFRLSLYHKAERIRRLASGTHHFHQDLVELSGNSNRSHQTLSLGSESSLPSSSSTGSFQSIPEEVVNITDNSDIDVSVRPLTPDSGGGGGSTVSIGSGAPTTGPKNPKKKKTRMINRKVSWVTGSNKEERLEVAINVLTMDQETEIAQSIRGFVGHFQGMCHEKRADAAHGGADELVWKVREYLEGLNSYVLTHKAEYPLLNSAIDDMKQNGKSHSSFKMGLQGGRKTSSTQSSGLGFESLTTRYSKIEFSKKYQYSKNDAQ